MKPASRRILIVTGILIMGGAAVFVWLLSAAMPIGTGYVAKYLCTSTFVSQRDPVRTFDEDVRPVNPWPGSSAGRSTRNGRW
jgi:hypothetical protein